MRRGDRSGAHGARTLLVERYGFLGGTATAAMVGPWMTFHSGRERIVGGIAQEIVERLSRAAPRPDIFPTRPTTLRRSRRSIPKFTKRCSSR